MARARDAIVNLGNQYAMRDVAYWRLADHSTTAVERPLSEGKRTSISCCENVRY
jgi:hypothetical protein